MARPRVTVARLMAIVLLVGLGLAALRNNYQKNAEIARLSSRLKEVEAEAVRRQETLTTILREMRDKVQRIEDAREPVWPPHAAMRFALLGKIDMNRDKKDDRDELKRMIKQAGGLVEFDLPPPEVGKETGTLSPRIDWYVTDSVDDRPGKPDQFAKRLGGVIKEARLNGTRPMRVERLLDYLRRPEPAAADPTQRWAPGRPD